MITIRFYLFSIAVVLYAGNFFAMKREFPVLALSQFSEGALNRTEISNRFLSHFKECEVYRGRNSECTYTKYIFSTPRFAQKLYIIQITSGCWEGSFFSTLAQENSDSNWLNVISEENMQLVRIVKG